MKKSIFLAISFFLTYALTAQHSPGAFRNPAPEMSLAENLTEISGKAEINNIFPGEATGQNTSHSLANEQILTQNRVDRIEFDPEKGVTLPGNTVAELVNQTPCATLDLSFYDQLPDIANLQILINNQPTIIQAKNVIAALNQVRAEQIKVIQINTSAAENPETPGAVDITIYISQVK